MADIDGDSDTVGALILCLETSNMLLKTYYEETKPGIKKDTILKMVSTNTSAIIEAMNLEGTINSADEEEILFVGLSELPPVSRAISLLEEIQDAYFLKDKIQPIINILKDGIQPKAY